MQIHLYPQQTSCSNVAQNSFTGIWEDKNFQVYFGKKIVFNVPSHICSDPCIYKEVAKGMYLLSWYVMHTC